LLGYFVGIEFFYYFLRVIIFLIQILFFVVAIGSGAGFLRVGVRRMPEKDIETQEGEECEFESAREFWF
jgi:hypothetical protein